MTNDDATGPTMILRTPDARFADLGLCDLEYELAPCRHVV